MKIMSIIFCVFELPHTANVSAFVSYARFILCWSLSPLSLNFHCCLRTCVTIDKTCIALHIQIRGILLFILNCRLIIGLFCSFCRKIFSVILCLWLNFRWVFIILLIYLYIGAVLLFCVYVFNSFVVCLYIWVQQEHMPQIL